MRKLFLFISVICVAFCYANAQEYKVITHSKEEAQSNPKVLTETKEDKKAKEEALKVQKIAFITQEVGLTCSEAEKFWPIYNELGDKLKEVSRERNYAIYSMRDIVSPRSDQPVTKKPEKSVDELMILYRNSFQKESTVRETYHAKFMAILSVEKVAKLYIAEERFRDKTFREFIDRKVRVIEHQK